MLTYNLLKHSSPLRVDLTTSQHLKLLKPVIHCSRVPFVSWNPLILQLFGHVLMFDVYVFMYVVCVCFSNNLLLQGINVAKKKFSFKAHSIDLFNWSCRFNCFFFRSVFPVKPWFEDKDLPALSPPGSLDTGTSWTMTKAINTLPYFLCQSLAIRIPDVASVPCDTFDVKNAQLANHVLKSSEWMSCHLKVFRISYSLGNLCRTWSMLLRR